MTAWMQTLVLLGCLSLPDSNPDQPWVVGDWMLNPQATLGANKVHTAGKRSELKKLLASMEGLVIRYTKDGRLLTEGRRYRSQSSWRLLSRSDGTTVVEIKDEQGTSTVSSMKFRDAQSFTTQMDGFTLVFGKPVTDEPTVVGQRPEPSDYEPLRVSPQLHAVTTQSTEPPAATRTESNQGRRTFCVWLDHLRATKVWYCTSTPRAQAQAQCVAQHTDCDCVDDIVAENMCSPAPGLRPTR